MDKTNWKVMTTMDGGVITSSSVHCASFFGKSGLVGAEGYGGTAGSDPGELIEFTIWAGRTANTTAGVVRVTAYVTLNYDAVFTQPKILGAS